MSAKTELKTLSAEVRKYRRLWIKKAAIEAELKKSKSKIYEQGKAYLEAQAAAFPDDAKHSVRVAGCIISNHAQTLVLTPPWMTAGHDRMTAFCKSHPKAVKFELVKSFLPSINLEEWGIETVQNRTIKIEVTDRGEGV